MPKKTVFLTTLLASLLVVGVASARADHSDRSRPHTRMDVSRLEGLSHRLERSVRHLQREVRRCTDHRRHRAHKPLPAMYRLENRASRFRHLVERRPEAVLGLIADFRAVDESFRVAERRVQRMHSRHLRHEFRRVGALIEELDRELQRKVRFARHRRPGHVGGHAWHSGYREFAWR